MSVVTDILYDNEYAHVVNNETGTAELLEGPLRFVLPANKSMVGTKKQKITLREDQYCMLSNPYNAEKQVCDMGKSIVVQGPKTFSLFPGEELTTKPMNACLLNKNQYLVIEAMDDFSDEESGKDRKAGELYTVQGPTLFIPKKHEKIVVPPVVPKKFIRDATNISDNEAVYVRNLDTSELKMVRGPLSYVLAVNEEEYLKSLTDDEYDALQLPYEPRSNAYSIQLQKNQCVCVTDYKESKERYVLGPDRILLGPHEAVKVINLSGGVPKRENVIRVCNIGLGIDFMTDQFEVRTKDNAVLNLTVAYKWKFILDDANLHKIFAGDFVGYSCQSLRSRIREESSKNDFEHFHTNSSQLLRDKLFKEYNLEVTKQGKKVIETVTGRLFSEFNFLVFSIDVRAIKPVDKEIEQLLENSIKASMRIMCSKLNDTAETQAEMERIESETNLSKLRKNLIEIENNNLTKEKIEKARIEGKALLEKATSEALAQSLLHQSKLNLQLENMRSQMNLLDGAAGDRYIEYMKVMSMSKNVLQATIIPSSTRNLINLGSTSLISEDLAAIEPQYEEEY